MPFLIEALKASPQLIKAIKGKDKSSSSKNLKSSTTMKKKFVQALSSGIKNAQKAQPKNKALKKSIDITKFGDEDFDVVHNAIHEHLNSSTNAQGTGAIIANNDRQMILTYPDNSGVANDSTMANSFAMTNLAKSDPFYDFAADSVQIRGVEYIQAIQALDSVLGQTIFTLPLNPTAWKDTRLAKYAQMFNYFRFKAIEVIYEPIVPKTVGGSLLGAILPNTAKYVPESGITGLRTSMELRSSVMHPVYSVQTLSYKFNTPTQPCLCVPVASAVTPYETTLSSQGMVFYKDASGLANNTYGQILIKYEICFYDSCLSQNQEEVFSDFETILSFNVDPATLLLQCGTTGVVPSVPFQQIYMVKPRKDNVTVGVHPFYAARTYWMVVAQTTTGLGANIYDTLIDALVGKQMGLRGTVPSATTGPVPFSVIGLSGFGPSSMEKMRQAALQLQSFEDYSEQEEEPQTPVVAKKAYPFR